MSEKIMTQHPQGKEGVKIDKAKYEIIKSAILSAVDNQGEIMFKHLIPAVDAQLTDFDGSVSWYVTTIKLDLEARGLIERIPKSSPQRIRRSMIS